jgi:GTPase
MVRFKLQATKGRSILMLEIVDAGKSTMLGVLVKGGLDDGRGKARVNLFRHKHEVESGRTSSVGMEIMGFDTRGNVVASSVPGRKLSWEEIGRRSVRSIASRCG